MTCIFSDQILDGVNPEEEKKKKEGEEKSGQQKSREEVIDETLAQGKLNKKNMIFIFYFNIFLQLTLFLTSDLYSNVQLKYYFLKQWFQI